MSLGMWFFLSGLLFGIAGGAFLWIPLCIYRCSLDHKPRNESRGGYSGSTPIRIVRPTSKGATHG